MPDPSEDRRPASRGRRTQARSAATREAILEAALHEFSAHGFDAASTRTIAARAGVHQPQINYHFSSKLELWQAAVDHLFEHLDAELVPAVTAALDAGGDPTRSSDRDEIDAAAATLTAAIGALIRTAHRYPQLNRIIVTEATHDSDRLGWIVDRHVAGRFAAISTVWQSLRAAGRVADVEPVMAYYTLIGAASLLYSNAPEARRLIGHDPIDDDLVERHIDLVVGLFLRAPTAGTPAASTNSSASTRPTNPRETDR